MSKERCWVEECGNASRFAPQKLLLIWMSLSQSSFPCLCACFTFWIFLRGFQILVKLLIRMQIVVIWGTRQSLHSTFFGPVIKFNWLKLPIARILFCGNDFQLTKQALSTYYCHNWAEIQTYNDYDSKSISKRPFLLPEVQMRTVC